MSIKKDLNGVKQERSKLGKGVMMINDRIAELRQQLDESEKLRKERELKGGE